MRALQGLFVAVTSVLATGAAALAGDHNPPPWRGLPNSTTQGWTFVNGAQQGQLPDPTVAPFHNPYSMLPFTDHPVVWSFGNTAPSPDGGLTILPGGWIDFLIPNNFDPTTPKEIWVQIKFSGPIPGVAAQGYDTAGQNLTPVIFGNPIAGPSPIPGTNIFEMTFVLRFDVNPYGEIVELFNNSTAPLTIYQVVIDTICPTPGTAAAGLLGVGLLASRRRR